MALNSPADLSLGKLGHIAAGNGDSTTETSLNDCGRDSGTAETAMWANFRCGNLSVVLDSGSSSAFDGDGKGIFKIRLKGDVGVYMGVGAGGEYQVTGVVNDLNTGDEVSYYYFLSEASDGSLYESRIAQNSDTEGDYDALFTVTAGSPSYTYHQDSTDNDKFRFRGRNV